MAEGKIALFPDSPTQRGTKHLKDLIALMERGFSTEIFYVIQREDCSQFAVHPSLDPQYAKTFQEASRKGLKASIYACKLNPQEAFISPSPINICGS